LSLSFSISRFCLIHFFSQADFYRGKTITIIQGRDPGGSGDLRAKAMIPFLQKHIPGNPAVISEYMPGGGGRKAAITF
jgi:tripartite-type tricarboxylate transporter receptor subunit TctC